MFARLSFRVIRPKFGGFSHIYFVNMHYFLLAASTIFTCSRALSLKLEEFKPKTRWKLRIRNKFMAI